MKAKKLAQGIKDALKMERVKEARSFWISYEWDADIPAGNFHEANACKYHACPLGLAFIGITGDSEEAHRLFNELYDKYGENEVALKELLGIGPVLFNKINRASSNGFKALDIADKLEQGLLR